MKPLNIFIGVDSREYIAYHVLAHSIMTRASRPVSITPLIQQPLRASGFYDRERGPMESTEFSMTRFLVPFLSDYQGISIFLDCDMLCLTDICDLEFEMAKAHMMESTYAVMCCQHDYTPKDSTKFLGQQQTVYPRKNWSSLMVFNNALCKALTPEYVSKASGLDLHRFNWLKDEQIGSLSKQWNWLVGEYDPVSPGGLNILHYTLGGPWFPEYSNCPYADLWRAELEAIKCHSQKLSLSPA